MSRTTLKTCVVISVVLLGAGSMTAAGRIITVDDDLPADFSNIQAAINDANNGDTIIVAKGIYRGDRNRDIDFLGKAIMVRSENGPENCIIDCNGTRTEPHRGFYFHSGEAEDSVVDGFTIINGYASSASPQQSEWKGGGILCRQSSPTIRNCIITGNTTFNSTGGGIRAGGGLITNCTIKGNRAIGLGEYGPGGGGISCGLNTMVSNCTISDNTAAFRGGGILCTWGNPTIMNCAIVGNSAGMGGGIGFAAGGDAMISNCTISGNLSSSGGGIGLHNSTPMISNCTINGNLASSTGGGIYSLSSTPMISNCTISGNLASSTGGGICSLGSTPTLVNCILWGDSSALGPEISNYCLDGSHVINISYSDIQGGQAQADVYPGCPLDWGAGNIDVDPRFFRPGYWGDVNDPNIVVEPNDPDAVWIDGDYHLQSQAGRWDPDSEIWVLDDVTSPGIDAGDPMSPVGPEPFPNGGRINMGAYGGTAEASKSYFGKPVCTTIVAGDINGDCRIDWLDFAIMAFHWLKDNNE